MKDGFIKVAAATPQIEVADCIHNTQEIVKKAKEMKQGSILVNLSGRGDKDIDYVVEHYGYGDQFFK